MYQRTGKMEAPHVSTIINFPPALNPFDKAVPKVSKFMTWFNFLALLQCLFHCCCIIWPCEDALISSWWSSKQDWFFLASVCLRRRWSMRQGLVCCWVTVLAVTEKSHSCLICSHCRWSLHLSLKALSLLSVVCTCFSLPRFQRQT